MSRLALDIGSSDALPGSETIGVPIRNIDAHELAGHIGRDLLLFMERRGCTEILGVGMLVRLAFDPDHAGGQLAVVGHIEWFANAIRHPLARRSRDKPWISIQLATFDLLRSQGLTVDRPQFEEAVQQSDSLANLRSLRRIVLARCGGRCELTGQSDAGRRVREDVHITTIKPLWAGGEANPGNCFAFSQRAEDAFAHFHFTVGGNGEVIVNHACMDAELIEAINPVGRMGFAQNSVHKPQQRFLAWHREQFFTSIAGQ